MPRYARTHTRRTRKTYKTRKNCKSKSKSKSKSRRFLRGGHLARIPPSAIVSVQQDPYSARMLVDTDTAEDMFEARGSYLL